MTPACFSAATASAGDDWLCSSYASVISTITLRPSTPLKRLAISIIESRMAVPPWALIAATASLMVCRSFVGPVTARKLARERGHQHLVLRPQVRREPAGRRADEVHVPPHALAAVHEQRERGRDRLLGHHVRRLAHAVLLEDELRRCQPADHAALLVVDPGFDEHARDLGQFGHDVGLEDDPVAADVALAVFGLDDDFPALKRVVVGPFDGVRRPRRDRSEQGAVHGEAHGAHGPAGRGAHLSDDAHRAGLAHAAERRGDSDGKRGGRL